MQVVYKKKDATGKAWVEDERVVEEKVEQEQHEAQKGDKSPSIATEIETRQGSGSEEGKCTPCCCQKVRIETTSGIVVEVESLENTD